MNLSNKSIGFLVCLPSEEFQKIRENDKELRWKFRDFPQKLRDVYNNDHSKKISLFNILNKKQDDIKLNKTPVKLYFLVKGVLKGYFNCFAWNYNKNELIFKNKDFVSINKSLKLRPIPGWRYFNLK